MMMSIKQGYVLNFLFPYCDIYLNDNYDNLYLNFVMEDNIFVYFNSDIVTIRLNDTVNFINYILYFMYQINALNILLLLYTLIKMISCLNYLAEYLHFYFKHFKDFNLLFC
jgi:hypothetical protein